MTRRTGADATRRRNLPGRPVVVPGMTVVGVLRPVGAVALLLLLTACAERETGAPPPGTSPSVAPPDDPDTLVLEVRQVGGYVTPEMLAARLPVVSVHADGRVLTEGPVIAIYPGPALPNVQVLRVDPADVQDLASRALAAGVGQGIDYGTPSITDVPSTRVTVATADGTEVTEVHALLEATLPGPGGEEPLPGLTPEQVAARAELRAFLDELTSQPLDQQAPVEQYEPEVLAVVVRPWVDPQDELQHPELVWPGPPLPGEPLGGLPDLSCVTVSGDALAPVLDAARQANSATPWVGQDGERWSLTFRPLLPDETGCADLQR